MVRRTRYSLARILVGVSLATALAIPLGVVPHAGVQALAAPPTLTRPTPPPPPPPPPPPVPGQDLWHLDTDTAQFVQGDNGQVHLHVYNAPIGIPDQAGWRTKNPSLTKQLIAFDPVHQNNPWIAWEAGCQGELDRNGVAVAADLFTAQAPLALAFDPVSGRLYVVANLCGPPHPTQLYTLDSATGTYLPVVSTLLSKGGTARNLAITGNGYLLAGGPKYPLTVLKLNGPGIWGRAPFLSSSARRLGSPISPPTQCSAVPCQYFEKGALLKGGSPVPLVAGLLASRAAAPLPVGGTTSTVTYGSLAGLTGRRVPPPAGFRHGVLAGPTGTFVPISAHLVAAPGEIVPPAFWRFLTNPRTVPGGWLRDIGLPLTPAVPATVTKGALGRRAITIQAFQDAILTDDPRNPPATQVERANIGSDYAAVFPAATR